MEDICNKPSFSLIDAEAIAWTHFGIRGVASHLPGERDQNFKLTCASDIEFSGHQNFVIKIANPDTDLKLLELENAALQIAYSMNLGTDSNGINSPGSGFEIPKLIQSSAKTSIVELIDTQHRMCFVRCISFLPGETLAAFRPHSPGLLSELGRQLGALDESLKRLNGFVAAKRELKWDLSHAKTVVEIGTLRQSDPAKKQWLRHFLDQYNRVDSRVASLPKSVIHNDANDYNILIQADSSGMALIGLIDFGDIVYSSTINDLAICGAYVMLDKQSPIEAAAALVSGYHETHPLSESEISVVFPMMCMRLCQSVCIAAEQQLAQPDNEYLGITEAPAWAALERLKDIDPSDVHQQLSDVCSQVASNRHRCNIGGEQIRELRERHVGPSLGLSYDQPLHIVRGSGQYLYDDASVTYLDCVNNVCHVGHCHPEVVAAATDQMALLNTNTRYLHENIVRYAQRLTATLPSPLEVCFFVNSGSEANDLALRMARNVSQHNDVVVIDHAYHGHVSSLIDLSPYKFNHGGGRGKPEHVHVVPAPDGYRGEFKLGDPECGQRYAEKARAVIESAQQKGRQISAFFAESLLGCGGQVPLPSGYLAAVYESVRAAGGVCVADEVQVGFGRVGSHFWGFEQQQVIPDIVTMGKPIGNGHPLAAVVTTRKIADAFHNGMEYFNTFGGNPVSCAVGLAVLDVIEKEQLQQHANDVGNWLIEKWNEMANEFDSIGDVRGSGLFLGIELVKNRETLTPATELTHAVVQRMRQRRILLSTDGPLENVIKFKPPMVFSHADAERLVLTLKETLRELNA